MPHTYKWDEGSINSYQCALAQPYITEQLSDFLTHTLPSEHGINQEAQTLNNIIHNAASQSLRAKKHKSSQVNKTQPWYHPTLKFLRQRVNAQGKLLKQFPNDPHIRGSYYKTLKNYRRSVKYHKKQFKQDMINKLDDLCSNSPRDYWKLLAKLKNENLDNDPTTQIKPDQWLKHFTELNSKSSNENINAQLWKNPLTCQLNHTLNKQIELNEVQGAIKALKNGKACGLDGISNEMIKYGQHVLIKPLTKLFNHILMSGIYPSNWSVGYISPIYKTGNPLDPTNYRGITITSCVAKVFNSVLNNRLDKHLTDNHIIHESQIGFKKKSRTSDHLFVLRTLTDKIVKNERKKLYACFVDFQKAFDSLSHTALFHKLESNGINGNFLNTIKNMYQNTKLCVKTQNQLTPSFPGEVGVRQGDILSPNIFKIFINDLPDSIITPNGRPPKLKDKTVGCLLYADDLVLLSETKDGLQTSLQNLNDYCHKWDLHVNTKKTKVMIFSTKKTKTTEQFYLGNSYVECVDEYKYLGITLTSNGSFDTAQKNLYMRGLKAYFKLVKILSSQRSGVHTAIHLFDHTVKPVLLYASEIWGSIDPNLRKIKNNPDLKLERGYEKLMAEKLHLKMCRNILGVNNKTALPAIRGEMGRFPIYIDVTLNILKYLNHLKNSTSDLLTQALEINQELARQNKYCWLTWAQSILIDLKSNEDTVQQPVTRWLPKLTKNLRGKYFNIWKDQISPDHTHGNKLRTYQKFKTSITREPYLDLIRDRNTRKYVAQLRTSSHKLHVETGRYYGKDILDRTCEVCGNGEVEDEQHFMISCNAYSAEREHLFQTANNLCPHFDSLTSEHKLIWLMSAENSDIVRALATFIERSFVLRSQILVT
jgi:hypothetical protein